MANLFKVLAAALVATATPAAAATTVHSFNTTGSMKDDGTYGNALSFSASTDPTLKLRVTGWQSNQATNDIARAWVGAYGGGLGVTGTRDSNGGSAFHQIDNVRGYTDFVMLQFNRSVTLSGITANTYQMGGVSGRDSDFAFRNAAGVPAASWNAAIDLTAFDTVPSLWTEVAAGGSSGARAMTPGVASNRWLLSASFLPKDRDDGFKLSQLRVVEQRVAAVPEPATWGMMLIGFGVVGSAMRRRRLSAGGARRAFA